MIYGYWLENTNWAESPFKFQASKLKKSFDILSACSMSWWEVQYSSFDVSSKLIWKKNSGNY